MTNTTPLQAGECADVFWAYLAGFVDGEGSISMCQNGPRFIVTNTYLPVLEYIKENLGVGYISEVGKNSPNRTRQCYHFNVGANGMRTILPKLVPYLQEKKELAIRMIAYMNTTTPQTAGIQGAEYYKKREDTKNYFLEEVSRRKQPTLANQGGV